MRIVSLQWSLDIHGFIFYLIVLLGVTSVMTRAQAPYQPGLEFQPIGIFTGESAQLTALNRKASSASQNSSCSVTLQFLDRQGHPIKERVVTLPPGKSASLDVSHGELPRDNSVTTIRGVLLFGYRGGAPPGPWSVQKFDCNIVPRMEIYDRSGRARMVLTEAKPLPTSPTPAQ
jgi:hypothetical protein